MSDDILTELDSWLAKPDWLTDWLEPMEPMIQRARDEIVALRDLRNRLDKMLQYPAQARAEALEEAAKVCEDMDIPGRDATGDECAAAIRALKR